MEQKIPPTGRAKLYLEESQNKSACQKNEILLLPLHAMAENYGLRRSKARRKLTEILYIFFFGIHTANVVQLADRIEQRAQLAAS